MSCMGAGLKAQGPQYHSHGCSPPPWPRLPHGIPRQSELRREHIHVPGPLNISGHRSSSGRAAVGHSVELQHANVLRQHRCADDQAEGIPNHGVVGGIQDARTLAHAT